MAHEEFAHCCAPLVGKRLLNVTLLDFTWSFEFERNVRISTEGHWRLVNPVHITASSEDHGQRFGLPADFDALERVRAQLLGKCVTAASITPRTGDLRVAFEDGHELQLLQLSSGYEAWRLTGVGGNVYCLGSGKIVDGTSR